MQTLRILGVLLVVLAGVLLLKQYILPSSASPVKTETARDKKEMIKTNPSPRPVNDSVVTSIPTATPVPPTSTPEPTRSASGLAPYRYPNASVQEDSEAELKLVSNDSAQTITDWYKNVISSQGLHTTSFVQTSSNDNILNKLAAGLNGGGQITVTISKPQASGSVTIDVIISHS